MKVLIVGSTGQLGRCLIACAPPEAEIVAYDHGALDITHADAVRDLGKRVRPELVINAAAYTAVDKAESEEDIALAANGDAVGYLSQMASEAGARFAHISTDFVFDGTRGTPYKPGDATNPINAYGRTKLVGEERAGADALIVRTAWVYAPEGGNFVRTMLRLMAEREELGVVSDQIGSPTYAPGLAQAIWDLDAKGNRGIFHYTDSGVASWYDFAVAIAEEGHTAGLLDDPARILPVTTADYPTPARRPAFSVLDKTATWAALGQPAPHWRENLRILISEIAKHG